MGPIINSSNISCFTFVLDLFRLMDLLRISMCFALKNAHIFLQNKQNIAFLRIKYN